MRYTAPWWLHELARKYAFEARTYGKEGVDFRHEGGLKTDSGVARDREPQARQARGRQGDKRATANCRYRFHRDSSRAFITEGSFGRVEEMRALSLPGEKLKEGIRETKLVASSKLSFTREIRIGIEAIYLGIGFAVADSLHRSNDRGKGCHLDKRGHK